MQPPEPMFTQPTPGDFVIELRPESHYFVVRREGASTILQRQFPDYVAAVSFARECADDRDVSAFLKTSFGWRCLR
jgi:hypothetical protein